MTDVDRGFRPSSHDQTLDDHPRALSRAIMSANPPMKPRGRRSGRPAANRFGNQFFHDDIEHRPRCRSHGVGKKLGRSEHERCADDARNRFHDRRELSQINRPRDIPPYRSGSAIASPSGMFWRPMPMVSAVAAPRSPPPKLTPTAMPSGKLWRVMASIGSADLCHMTRSLRHGLVWKLTVQVRQALVSDIQKRCPDQQSDGRRDKRRHERWQARAETSRKRRP